MDKVAGRVAREDDPPVGVGQKVAAVDEDATGGREPAERKRRGCPVLAQGEHLPPELTFAQPVLGHVLDDGGGGKVGVTLERAWCGSTIWRRWWRLSHTNRRPQSSKVRPNWPIPVIVLKWSAFLGSKRKSMPPSSIAEASPGRAA